MGIRFNRNSWRAPLRLIDSLLPQPSTPARMAAAPLNRTTEAFARAGWLGRGRAVATPTPANAGTMPSTSEEGKPAPCRLVASYGQRVDDHGHRSTGALLPTSIVRGSRVTLAGRIDAVCAELERLAAMEEAALPQAA